MRGTAKYVSYVGKKLEDLLSDLCELEEYREERAAELEISIYGPSSRRILYMLWEAPLGLIPNRIIEPFLKKKINYAWFTKYDDVGRSIIRLEY